MRIEVPHFSPTQQISFFPSVRPSLDKNDTSPTLSNSDPAATNASRKSAVLNKKMTLQSVLQNSHRTVEEAKFLYRIVKDMPFFSDFKKNHHFEESEQEMLIDLCKNSKYERYEPTDVIFKEGDKPDGKFYILLRGIVYIVQREESSKNFFEEQNKHLRVPVELQRTSSVVGSNNSDSQPSTPKSNRINFSGATSRQRTSRRDSRNPSVKLAANFSEGFSGLQKNFRMTQLAPSTGFQASRFSTLNEKTQSNVSLEVSDTIESQEIRSSGEKSVKLKSATNKLIQLIKIKGALGENRGSAKETLQSRVAEYGIYRAKIERGGSFGHAALEEGNVRRNATTIAATPVDLLVIQKEHLQMIREHFHRSRNIAKEFLLKYFPCIEDINASKIIDTYLFLLKEEIFPQSAIICQEGCSNDKIYVLSEGKCQLMKTFIVEDKTSKTHSELEHLMRSQKMTQKQLPLSILERGAFIAEETLFNNDEKCEYTVRVISPSAKFYSIERSVFAVRFPKMTQEKLQRNHLLRQKNYVEIANSILRTKFASMEVVHGHDNYHYQLENNAGVFQKPIVIVAPYDPLNYKSNTKQLPEADGFDVEGVKNKLIDFSHGFYTKNENSSEKTLPQFANILSLQEIQKKNRSEINFRGLNRTRVDKLKFELADLSKDYEEKEAIFPPTENPRKTLLRNREINRAPINEYIERAVKNFCTQTNTQFFTPKDPSDIEAFKVGFGRKYELNRKKKGWEAVFSSRNAREVTDPRARIKRLFEAANKSKEKYLSSSRNQVERTFTKISSVPGHRGNKANMSDCNIQALGNIKPKLPKIDLTPMVADTTESNQSIETPGLRESCPDFLCITAMKTGNSDNSPINTVKTNFSGRKSIAGGGVIQALIRKHQTLKALNKQSHNTTFMNNKSCQFTPTSLGITNYVTNDSFNSMSFTMINNSKNL